MKLKVKYDKIVEFESGYGVAFIPIWEGEDEPERIVDVDAEIVEISLDNIENLNGVPHLKGGRNLNCHMYYSVNHFPELENLWEGDTHDLRDRWFATKEEAEEHMNFTLERFQHPQPWESFVKI